MHAEQKVDVFGFVSKIREQRSQLIQTDVSWSSHMSAKWHNTFLDEWIVRVNYPTLSHLYISKCVCVHLCVFVCSHHRCSTHSSTRPCSNTTSTGTRSWTCRLWKDICTNCTTPSQTATGSAWRKSLRWDLLFHIMAREMLHLIKHQAGYTTNWQTAKDLTSGISTLTSLNLRVIVCIHRRVVNRVSSHFCVLTMTKHNNIFSQRGPVVQ